ncbi:MAG: hypothetical protein KAQ62_00345, partial [Cyclobacteriaceae bacterium]|nr:hypothetical protein [Cyclobacteriaceae bacterium]
MRLIFILLLFIESGLFAQNPADYFNRAANEYIYQNEQIALNTLDAGLTKYPNDTNLTNLKEKIEKDKQKKEQEQQQQQEQQNEEDQQNKEQEQ